MGVRRCEVLECNAHTEEKHETESKRKILLAAKEVEKMDGGGRSIHSAMRNKGGLAGKRD